MRLVSVQEMKSLEESANSRGLSYDQMMESAGFGVAREVDRRYRNLITGYPIVGLVGSGNNGGDTLIALKHLALMGWDVIGLLFHREDGDPLVQELVKAEIPTGPFNIQTLDQSIASDMIILDGLLGTGTKLPLKPDLLKPLAHLKQILNLKPLNAMIVAVDTPSGIDCDTGEVASSTLPANLTICMAAVKQGMLATGAIGYCGEIVTIPIGINSVLPEWEKDFPVLLDASIIHNLLPRRLRTGHKGTFGSGLVVGGSANYSGAPYLAGKAAAKIGTGLVQMAVPSFLHPILAGSFPEATWLLLPEEEGVLSSSGVEILRRQFDNLDGMLIGPGLGLEPTTGRLIQSLLQPETKKSEKIGFLAGDMKSKKDNVLLPPLVFDADGLKLLSKIPNWHDLLPEGTILTPHPGEMSILTGLEIANIQSNREEIATQYAKEWNCVVVLKGAGTVIADPSGRMYRLPLATSALAHAGSGDVLAGLILGLRVQGIPPFDSACAAVWIHGMAALSTAAEKGHPAAVLAGDIIENVGPILGSVWPE